jgi:hypothetical protein
MSSKGYGWDWRFWEAVFRLSAMRTKSRAEVDELRAFYRDHPELKPTKHELENMPPEQLAERAKDWIEAFKRVSAPSTIRRSSS